MSHKHRIVLLVNIKQEPYSPYRWENQMFTASKGNFIVDWGDGTIELNSTYHDYDKPGIYRVIIEGDLRYDVIHFDYIVVHIEQLDIECKAKLSSYIKKLMDSIDL